MSSLLQQPDGLDPEPEAEARIRLATIDPSTGETLIKPASNASPGWSSWTLSRTVRVAAILIVVAMAASVVSVYLQTRSVAPVRTIPLGGWDINAKLDVSPAGDELLTAAYTINPNFATKVLSWQLPHGSTPDILHEHSSLLEACYSPCGRYVAIGGDSCIRIIERASNRTVHRFVVTRPFSDCISFSRDSRWLAATGGSTELLIWNLSDGSGPALVETREFWHAAFMGKGDELLIVHGSAQFASVWSAASNQWRGEFPLQVGAFDRDNIAFTKDGGAMALFAADGNVQVWDVERRQLRLEFFAGAGAHDTHRSLCFSADERLLATAVVEKHSRPWIHFRPPYFDWVFDHYTVFSVWNAETGRLVRQWTNRDLNGCLRPIPGSAEFVSIAKSFDANETRLHFWPLPDP